MNNIPPHSIGGKTYRYMPAPPSTVYFLPQAQREWYDTTFELDRSRLTPYKHYEQRENENGDLGVTDDNGNWLSLCDIKGVRDLRRQVFWPAPIDLSGFDQAAARMEHLAEGLAVLAREDLRLATVEARAVMARRHQQLGRRGQVSCAYALEAGRSRDWLDGFTRELDMLLGKPNRKTLWDIAPRRMEQHRRNLRAKQMLDAIESWGEPWQMETMPATRTSRLVISRDELMKIGSAPCIPLGTLPKGAIVTSAGYTDDGDFAVEWRLG